ncbi:hypothetical protein [Yunchengibacter salinarum]|uniref:hypothetical protein n=1 Tax=Yunchengibacter salinarum TaxID=3133399 RepID=UPI0035B59E94
MADDDPGNALTYWENLRGERPMPVFTDLTPDGIRPFRDNSLLLDMRDPHGKGPVIRFCGPGLAADLLGETPAPGTPLESLPFADFRETLYSHIRRGGGRDGLSATDFHHEGKHGAGEGVVLPLAAGSDSADKADLVLVVMSPQGQAPESHPGGLSAWAAEQDPDGDANPAEDPHEDAAPDEDGPGGDAPPGGDDAEAEMDALLSGAENASPDAAADTETEPEPEAGTDHDPMADDTGAEEAEDGATGDADAEPADVMTQTGSDEDPAPALDAFDPAPELDTKEEPPADTAPAPDSEPEPAAPDDVPADLEALLHDSRAAATHVIHTDMDSRDSLYDALARALALYEKVQAKNKEDGGAAYQALLQQAGLRAQKRAPFTPILKLIFGRDFDKTRLTEYAAALAWAVRSGVRSDDLADFLRDAPGGIKGCVRLERDARHGRSRQGRKAESTRAARRRLARVAATDLTALPADDLAPGEWTLVLARKGENDQLEAVDRAQVPPATLNDVMRRVARQQDKG